MTTPEQLTKWSDSAEKSYFAEYNYHETDAKSRFAYILGYQRRCQKTEQAMKLAKFGADVLANTQFTYQEVRDLSIKHDVANFSGSNWQAIKELLND